MPDNQPNGSIDSIEEGMRKIKIEDNDGSKEGNTDQLNPYPDRPGEPDCIYYLRTGLCGYGRNCRFNHPAHAAKSAANRGELPQREGQPDCGYYLKTGSCKYGSTCKYNHPSDRRGAGQVVLNVLGLPMRPEEKPCPYYMRTWTCKFGGACKFDHPQPASFQTVLPVPGSAAIGLTAPRVHGSQSYMQMPLGYSSLQGPIAVQAWNPYVGSSAPADLLTTSMANLPERPGQPECRYFMSTGSCKYGTDCKFHHPKEKTTGFSLNGLGPHGLPLRPGAAMCTNFSSYGICKFGPNCKFDHPIPPFLSSPFPLPYSSLPILDPSLFSYPRTSFVPVSLETSPSRSSKVTNWIRKSDQSSDIQIQNSNLETPPNEKGVEPSSSEISPVQCD